MNTHQKTIEDAADLFRVANAKWSQFHQVATAAGVWFIAFAVTLGLAKWFEYTWFVLLLCVASFSLATTIGLRMLLIALEAQEASRQVPLNEPSRPSAPGADAVKESTDATSWPPKPADFGLPPDVCFEVVRSGQRGNQPVSWADALDFLEASGVDVRSGSSELLLNAIFTGMPIYVDGADIRFKQYFNKDAYAQAH